MPNTIAGGRISAIGTTGIYCRPGCPGRPLERNRTRYPSALAAEAAGYRACLRCRPEREPQFDFAPQWPAHVERAMWAIATGWTERHDVNDLAAAVGIDSAELDDAFAHHVGASPQHVAESRRLHVARTLLDCTDLAVDRVAIAVGYDSAAELAKRLVATFEFEPERLRANRYAREGRSIAARAPAIEVPLYHWPHAGVDATFDYLQSRATPGIEESTDDGYRRLVPARSKRAKQASQWVELRNDADGLRVRIEDPGVYSESGELLEIITRARRLLALDELSSAHATALLADPILGCLIDAEPGRRLAGAWDPFETAVRIIVGQQVTVSAASTLAGRVVERCGQLTAAAVASASLNDMGMPASRVATLQTMAEAVLAGDVDLDHIGGVEQASASLMALRGIGPWTAQLIAVRIMRYPDAWPVRDIGLIRAWEHLGGDGHIDEVSERWRPHRSAAVAYLWSAA